MDGVSLVVGIVPIVVQLYNVVSKGYDTYIEFKEFPSSYRELQIALMIERQRLDLWGQKMLSDHRQRDAELSHQDLALWKIFEAIFLKMAAELEGSARIMEVYEHLAGQSKKAGLLDNDEPDSLSMNAETALKHTVNSVARKFKFILKDKKKVERLAKRLCYYNDSLDKMTSRQEQESSRRRLRTHFSTQDPEKLHLLQQAAALLEHHDIETMANSRSVLETGYPVEHRSRPPEKEDGTQGLHGYRLEYHELEFHGIPFSADQPRAVATFQQETVLVDWRCCRDDTWRKENPIAFRQRTENLTRILNSDLRSLNLSVLHCVGYIDRNTTVTGYAFRLPPEANSKQKPLTLHHLLTNVTKPSDIPDLGERFEVAKALVSTVFEFHNMGWMHKNVQSKNILFWPKAGTQNEPNLSKPYLVGFDISRPNQPGEVSEKPFSNNEDDLYRHPDYKGSKANSFQPPFDIYSLGIVLFEIGLWAAISRQTGPQVRRGARPPLKSHVSYTDPEFIENVMKGPVMDLKQYMGVRYRDAVITCLNGTFDKIWEQSKGEDRMQLYQEEVQSKLVDIIALCNA